MTTKTFDGKPLTPGVNVDPVDIEAGLKMMTSLGYDSEFNYIEVDYNLKRWTRGEEAEADHSMSNSLSGVNYTSWRMILAAAVASGTAKLEISELENQE